MKPGATISFDFSDPILAVCKTTWERRKLLDELRTIEKYLYTGENTDIRTIIIDVCRESSYDIVMKIVGSERAKCQDRIQTMRAAIKAIPEVDLSLAFEPTVGLILRIYTKVIQLVKTPVVLNLHYEPMLIGGAALTYQGKYGDYSVRQKIENLLKTQGLV